MTKTEPKKQRGWLNKSEMAASLGISVQAFDKWGVQPVERIGREAFYDCRSVVANRHDHAEAKHQPEDDSDEQTEKRWAQERLRLTAAQAEGQELKNDVTKRRSVPTEFATFALSRIVPAISSAFDTLPMVMRRRHPDLQARHLDTLEREATKIRNAAAQLADRLPGLLDEYLDSTD